MGLFRYRKLPFGLANAPAIFSRILHRLLRECDGVISYFDDILVWGSNQKEHDKNLLKLKGILSSNKLTINEGKSVYNQTELDFIGRRITRQGIKPILNAATALINSPVPNDKKELKSFLGMIGFYRSFFPNFSTIASPLYKIVNQDSVFNWDETADKSFKMLITSLKNSQILAFFDTSLNTTTILTTDASSVGLGAYLVQIQNGKEVPIYFISRKLSACETKYSIPELETLAVIWSVERFHQFLYGRKFQIRTDHKALKEVLSGKATNSTAPARISRWATRLLPYSFTVQYVRGAENVVADGLSRLPLELPDEVDSHQISVSSIVEGNIPCITLTQLHQASLADDEIQEVIQCVKNKWPGRKSECSAATRQYFDIRSSLSIVDGILFRSEKIVPPLSLRPTLLAFAHESHFGISKTKMRLRSFYWWPKMDESAESLVRNCVSCPKSCVRDVPVGRTEWPTTPWTNLAIDIAGPKYCKNNIPYYIIVLIDLHSKYAVAKICKSITSSDVIMFLEDIFFKFGYPLKLISDNGVQFRSHQFENYLKHNGVSHSFSAVYNPQSNGSVERMNKNIKKLIISTNAENMPISHIETMLATYLLNYNNTVHETTSVTPSSLFYKFNPRTKLEIVTPLSSTSETVKKLHQQIGDKQTEKANYADYRRCPIQKCKFKVGDFVRVGDGPVRRLVSQIGPFTFRDNLGYAVNARTLVFARRGEGAETEYININTRRYPVRDRHPPERLQ